MPVCELCGALPESSACVPTIVGGEVVGSVVVQTPGRLGVAMLPGDAVNGEQLLRAADRALYAAKNAGRNRVEIVRSGEAITS